MYVFLIHMNIHVWACVFLLCKNFRILKRRFFYIYNVANFMPVFMSKNIHNILTIYLFFSALQKPCQMFIHKCIKLHEKTLDKLKNSWNWRFSPVFALFFSTKTRENIEISTFIHNLRIFMHKINHITIWQEIDIYWQMAIFQCLQAFLTLKIADLSV